MKLNLKNLSQPLESGIIPALEVARACHVLVGEPNTRRYKSWEITYDGREHIEVKSPKYSTRRVSIWMVNGDVDVYQLYEDGEDQEHTDNQALIQRVYSAFGFEITYDKWQNDMIDRIISESKANGVCSHGCNQGWTSPSIPCHCNPLQIRIGADER